MRTTYRVLNADGELLREYQRAGINDISICAGEYLQRLDGSWCTYRELYSIRNLQVSELPKGIQTVLLIDP